MRVRLWGERGSLPTLTTPEMVRFRLEEVLSQFENLRDSNVPVTAQQLLETLPVHLAGGYGGHTSCGEVESGKSRLIIDAGSGLREFPDMIMKTAPGTDEFHLYFTHFHWDH